MSKKRILLICQYYFPGYRAGGPQQTIKNVIEVFGNDVDFHILTSDHDLGCYDKYFNIRDGWNQVGKAKVMYLSDKEFDRKTIGNYADQMDVVYCCGLFEKSTIQALLANRIKPFKAEFYIAAMGVFSEGAYKQKHFKKSIFVTGCRLLRMFHNVKWSFTSEEEARDATRIMGRIAYYIIAEDIPRPLTNIKQQVSSDARKLKIVFLSRICTNKNLAFCMNILNGKWDGEICFDIYGPIENQEYWDKCMTEMKKLPQNVTCKYCGEVNSDKVQEVFANYDIFLFPTLGENFGHVIYEAMSVGCIPIISDTTPWLDLNSYGCGRVMKLDSMEGFRESICEMLSMDAVGLNKMKKNAEDYAKCKRQHIILNSGYKKIFLDTV